MRAQEFIIENADPAAVSALQKKHGWSTGTTVNGDLYFTWQGLTYVFYGERMRINVPNTDRSISVVWGKKPDWQGRGNDEISFAQAVQRKILKFDLSIWQQLDRGQINDNQALQKFKVENERQAREALAQGVAEGSDSNLSYQGNCTEDDVIEHIFGDVNNFANMVEEHGDEFTVGDLVVKYDPETDVHSFYYKKQGVAEFAPGAADDNDKKSYLLQLAQALGDAMYGPNKNKQAVLDIKSKIVDAGGDVKILWNDDGTFNVVMYHPTYFKQGYLIKLVGGQAPGSLSENNKVESKLSVDVPNEEWLQDKIDYAQSKGRNSYGVPYMGSTTASVRGAPPRVRVMRLASLPGMRDEQRNVRRDDLAWLMDYMEKTGKLPPMGSSPDDEYLPYIMVAYNGEAWVNEGNHRIMAAYRLNWQDMPIEIRYFDGGERVESGPMAPGKIGLA